LHRRDPAGNVHLINQESPIMKIRIQDNSVRFRITLKELEALNQTGRIESVTEVYSPEGTAPEGRFVYAVAAADIGASSRCAIEPGSITVYLNDADRVTLNSPSEEGVYLRREHTLASGETRRFMAFVEKDRPASKCDKPEAWIYDTAKDGSVASTLPSGRPLA
jgi:hypothetical protein